jgi:hypothetical protein
MENTPIIPLIELSKNIHTFQKFHNTPMYTIKGYLDTLVVQLSLVPFVTNGTCEHDHG